MLKAQLPSNEEERLKELLDYRILDTEAESAYDELCSLASIICQTPIALVSLIDRDRQWFKSKKGVDASELPRDTSFCGHAIHEKEILIVRDSRKDMRFHDNPFVSSGAVGFYAGVPLTSPAGYPLGTLCIADRMPRDLSDEQIFALKTLAKQVVHNLELRRSLSSLNEKYSEIKYLSKVVTSQKTELIETAKFVAIGTLAAGMAHEINNPLAVIHGTCRQLKVMLDKNFDKEKVLKLIGPVELMIQRIASITRGMLDYSQDYKKDEVCNFSLHSLIQKALDMCRERLAKSCISVMVSGKEDIQIEGRFTQIFQILIHLINNAYDAIHESNGEKWIRVEVAEDHEKLYLSVSDSGKGVPSEIAGRIMEPFFTTKAVGKGTGLGLSISKGIAEAHQGNLYLDTHAAHTRFVLELPRSQSKPWPPILHLVGHE